MLASIGNIINHNNIIRQIKYFFLKFWWRLLSKKSEAPQASRRAGFRHFTKNKNAKKYVFFINKKQIYFYVSFAYSENMCNYIL